MQKPKVSVIMNCLNCAIYLCEAIDSVFAQTYTDWEIIFWDNASTDNSAEIAKSYDERLRYFRSEETIPLGAARNKALEQARGDFVAFLDCDDLWMPEKLEKQIPLFDDPEVGLVYSDVIEFNERGEERRIYNGSIRCKGMCFSKLLKDYFLYLPTVVIRRTILDQEIEWFNTRFELIEDFDLFVRIAYSWKLDMHPDALAKYRVHLLSSSWQKGDLSCKEKIILLDNYNKLWPDFSTKYSLLLKKQIYYSKALYLWRSKKGIEARDCLSPYIFKSSKALLLYLASFFPPEIVYRISDKFRKKIKPKGFLSPTRRKSNN